jgi:hypothetical protein
MSAGKGDSPRPVDIDTYGKNYESIFRKPKQDSNKKFKSWNLLIAQFHEAANNKDSALTKELHEQIVTHPFYTGKP